MKLIFVYNAKSGKLNSLIDVGHKILSPKTYACQLCALTFDTFSENKIWKEFRLKTKVEMEFYHSDEFEDAFPNEDFDYPIILSEDKTQTSVIISAEELNDMETLDILIEKISEKLRFIP